MTTRLLWSAGRLLTLAYTFANVFAGQVSSAAIPLPPDKPIEAPIVLVGPNWPALQKSTTSNNQTEFIAKNEGPQEFFEYSNFDQQCRQQKFTVVVKTAPLHGKIQIDRGITSIDGFLQSLRKRWKASDDKRLGCDISNMPFSKLSYLASVDYIGDDYVEIQIQDHSYTINYKVIMHVSGK